MSGNNMSASRTLRNPGRRLLLVRGVAASLGAGLGLSAKSAEGINDKELRLGQSAAMTGPISIPTGPFTEAARAYFELVNKQGGIHGRRIVLSTLDDAYVPAKTAENVKQLIEEERVLALFGVLGVANTAVALPIATEARTPLLFPLNGDPAIRRTPNRYFFTCAASFADEIDRLVEHVTTIGGKKIAVAHLANPFGAALREAAEEAAKRRGATITAVASFDIQGDKTAAARQLAAKSADAVIVGAVGASAADFIQAYRAAGAASLLLTFSGANTDVVIKQLGSKAAGLVVSQIVPFPWSPTIPIVREYQAVSKARGQEQFSNMGLWGHVSARTMVEALKRAGGNVTREKLVDVLEAMKRVDIGHYIIDFDAGKHHGSRFADITLVGNNGKLVK